MRPRAPGEPRLRLFCFPYAGGGPSAFRRWGNHLPTEVECCLVQLPGKESRILESPVRRMDLLVREVHRAIDPLLDRRFAFFGHSMGGKVAFELARELRRAGRPGPAKLFISATRAPRVPDPDPPLHHLPDGEFVSEIQSRYDAIPRDVLENRELLELVLPGLRADFEVMETHDPGEEPPLECPITSCGGLEDDRVGEEGIAGWRAETEGGFEMRMFEGDHFYIQSHEAEFLPYFRTELEKLLV
ncbi:MAG: thioesterase II family protein [Vicinamibacteria bacterium]